tara:strand:- start:204 stop:467 length:264 start_codon:yes stop_codon:yes gene_type:complete
MISQNALRKLLEEEEVIIGSERTIKGLQKGVVSRVLVSSNVAASVKDRISRYAKLSSIPVESIGVANDAVGVMCKKPYSISVLSVKK